MRDSRRFYARHDLGQNFIRDPRICAALAEAAGIESGDLVLEVGCGQGDLTAALLNRSARVVGCETDPRLIPMLEERFEAELATGEFTLLVGDAQLHDFRQFVALARQQGRHFRVAANLPYYLTREFLIKFFTEVPEATSMSFMLQKEAVERLIAPAWDEPGYVAKRYGPMALLARNYGRAEIAYRPRRQDFQPAPHVDSLFVRLERCEDCPEASRMLELWNFYCLAFNQRRKTLLQNLKSRYSIAELRMTFETLSFKAQVRAEELSPQDFATLIACLERSDDDRSDGCDILQS
ncbi:MAG: 16S rRNA (adenine(1518)-N(6)/adenine(1519)-N(6))-dimethyltransferase RsmA [Eubacteriales bacterium]|nr:16S rRNA (adenine(1518)-N(6)/adenine(1519)-N(6))-dimethyltransferase RsmA [Eubacteriales bacterium]